MCGYRMAKIRKLRGEKLTHTIWQMEGASRRRRHIKKHVHGKPRRE
jgi:hypothetical protein